MNNNKAHLTAIVRKAPSLPMQYLNTLGVFKYRDILDYGCGRGFDALYYGIDGYDPHYSPNFPNKLYDVITCNYVLNVVSKEEAESIITLIESLLKETGMAYFTVRRDKFQEGVTSKHTYQRHVYLDLPHIDFRNKFTVYTLSK